MRSNSIRCLLLLLLVLACAAGCSKQQKPQILGKWRPIDVENRDATLEFFADGKVRVNSSEVLDWMLVGREMHISYPDAPTRSIRALVSLPNEQDLEVAVLDPQTGRYESHRKFKRIGAVR